VGLLSDGRASQRVWLKRIDLADGPIADDWSSENPHLLSVVRFDARPHDIGEGDLLVYEDPASSRIFAIAETLHDGSHALHDPATKDTKWLFLMKMRALVGLRSLRASPKLREVGIVSRNRYSYRPVTRSEHAKVIAVFNDADPQAIIDPALLAPAE
jgi:hypothetical protein